MATTANTKRRVPGTWTRALLAMATNNVTDGNDGVPVWEAHQKRAAVQLEKAGKVIIVRTKEKFAGLVEWRVFLPARARARAEFRGGVKALARLAKLSDVRPS